MKGLGVSEEFIPLKVAVSDFSVQFEHTVWFVLMAIAARV